MCKPGATRLRGRMPACVADLIVHHAHVVTLDTAAPSVEALAIRGETIVAVGTDAEIATCTAPRTLDLHGATVLPGFIDAHAHPGESGMERGLVNLEDVATIDEAVARARAWRAANPDPTWIEGGGWDTPSFPDAVPLPALDAAFGDTPVYFASADGHSGWANSAALRAAHLLTGPDPAGGAVLRGPDGAPTGVVRETATDVVTAAIPTPPRATIDAGLRVALGELARFGITSVVEAASDPDLLAGWRRLERSGALTARIFAAVPVEPGEGAAGVTRVARLARRYHSDRLRVDAVKLFFDGVVETETATLVAPYLDGTNAPPQFTDAELDSILPAAARAGLAVHGHALGDGAVRQALDAEARAAVRPRMILAHLELVDPADVPRFASLGVVADLQPFWAYPDPYVTTGTVPVLGPERVARLYPFGDLLGARALLAAGSDWSVTTLDPWPAIEVAVTRRDPETPGEALAPDQALPLSAILAAYTTGGAHAVAMDGRLGVLRPGAYADFVVLNRDPLTTPPADLSTVKVTQTWMGGRMVWDAAPPDGLER